MECQFDKTLAFFFFLLHVGLFILPQSRTYTPRDLQPNARESDACKRSNCLWTRTLDRCTRTGLPECVVSTMSGPLPKTAQDRTQTKDRNLEFLAPPGIEPGPPGWKSGILPTTPRRRMTVALPEIKIIWSCLRDNCDWLKG